jgi:hypothetical protein
MGDALRTGGLQREQQGQYQHQHNQQSSAVEEQERYHQQEQSLSIPPSPAAPIQDRPPDDLPHSTGLAFQSQFMNTTLSQETMLKIYTKEKG